MGNYPAYIGLCKEADSRLVGAYLNAKEVMVKFPEGTQFIFGKIEEKDGVRNDFLPIYAIRKDFYNLSNKFISTTEPSNDQWNMPTLNFTFNQAGAKKWGDMTYRNVGKTIAICINDRVHIAPKVMQKIDGGIGRITNLGTIGACSTMAAMLTAEDLLLPTKVTHIKTELLVSKPPSTPSPYWKLLLIFIATFALSFSLAYFIFKPNKPVSAKPRT